MAHVQLFRDKDGVPRVVINGLDFTEEIYRGCLKIGATGIEDGDEMCLDLRIGIGRLDVDGHEDIDSALLVGGGGAFA